MSYVYMYCVMWCICVPISQLLIKLCNDFVSVNGLVYGDCDVFTLELLVSAYLVAQVELLQRFSNSSSRRADKS